MVERFVDIEKARSSILRGRTMEIKENEILANHSTFRIGGPARYFVVAKSREEILEAINFAKEKSLPFFAFGGGSNILFRDEGFSGVAIKLSVVSYQLSDTKIIVGAGMSLAQVIIKSVDAGLAGLEWGVGIPGTIGGCVAGNCGAYGHDISESVESVSVLDENGAIKKYSKTECGFNYRESVFKRSDKKEIILEIELALNAGDKEKSKAEIKETIENRKGKIPPYPSIGSIFKNPKPLVARKLIEECGLKGEKIGGAQFSDLHANFIVNLGGAKAADVLALIDTCKEKVREKFKIDLEEEIVII